MSASNRECPPGFDQIVAEALRLAADARPTTREAAERALAAVFGAAWDDARRWVSERAGVPDPTEKQLKDVTFQLVSAVVDRVTRNRN